MAESLRKHGISYHFTCLVLACVAAVFSRAKSLTRITERSIDAHERHLIPSWLHALPLTMIHRFTARVDAELLDTVVNPWVVQDVNARTVGLRAVVIDRKGVQGA